MNMETFGQLLNNAGLLLSVSILNQIGHLIIRKRGKYSELVDGVILGVIAITVMINPMTFIEGLVFDTRSILLSVSALYLGPIPAIVAAFMAMAYRIAQGGVGTVAGVLVIISVTGFGLLWRKTITGPNKRKAWSLYQFGLLTHIIMISCMFALPWDLAIVTVKNIALPVLVLYPFASLMLSVLIQTQLENSEMVQKISESESMFRSLFELNHAVMLILDPISGQVMDANQAAVHFYGWDRSTLLSMNIDQINIMDKEQIRLSLELSITKEKNHYEFQHRCASGEIKNVEVYSGPVARSGRQLLYSIIHDITDRVKAQNELTDSEMRFRSLVENAPYAIFIQMDLKFYYLNRTACNLFGISSPTELIDKPVMNSFHPDSRVKIMERIMQLNTERMIVPQIDEVFLRIDQSPVDVNVVAVPYKLNNQNGALVFALDITEYKALENKKQEFELKMRQQQKMEAIGILAGGVAHEINNPINGIMNYAQLILDSFDNFEETTNFAKEIIRETERVSGIVKNLLQFARMEKQSHSYANLYDIVNRTISLTNVILKKDNIILDVQLDADLPELKCRSQQLQQVIMNLLTNSRDALNDRYPQIDDQKRIEVRANQFNKENRRWIELSIKDYGTGIDPLISQKIFEPFFSTKAKDKGTGLGLSISYGIIKDHHGEIIVESQMNEFSKFRVILPVDNGWEKTEVTHD